MSLLRRIGKPPLRFLFSHRTLHYMSFDWLRFKANLKNMGRTYKPASSKLHVGCGRRKVPGWLNVDVAQSDCNVDLFRRLPFPDASFDTFFSQHVIEHFDLRIELLPLLKELRRVAKPGAEIWLDCPDLEKLCRAYVEDKGKALREVRYALYPNALREYDMPPQQEINDRMQYDGQHKNLFDFELLAWALAQAGFGDVERMSEADADARFPEMPHRNDDYHSIYVRTWAK